VEVSNKMVLENLLKAAKSFGMSKKKLIGKIQELYAEWLESDFIDDMRWLYKTTEIRPQFSERLLQVKYADLVEREMWHDFAYLRKLLEVEPSKKVIKKIQDKYRESVRQNILSNLKYVSELIGIKPELPESIVCVKYHDYIKEEDFEAVAMLNELVGSPDEEFVQEWFRKYLEDEDLVNFKNLKDALPEISPSEEIIQEAYNVYLNRRSRWDLFFGLYKITKIRAKLPSKTVQGEYMRSIDRGQLGDFVHLMEVTGVKPVKEVYQIFLECLQS